MFNKNYWEDKWRKQQTGWDMGHLSPPIQAYIDQLSNTEQKILIPGSGNSYEGEYLFKKGFQNTYLLDLSEIPFLNLKKRYPEFPDENLIVEDFFKLSGQYDLIQEQTFFSAIPPHLRMAFAKKIHELLVPGGKMAGLLFGIEFNKDYPPFGGLKEDYIRLFDDLFEIKALETAYNSIEPRSGNELFIILQKK